MSNQDFTFKLNQLVKSLGITQRDLADRLNVSPAHVSHLLKGNRAPTLALAYRLSQIDENNVDYWFNDKDKSLTSEEIFLKRLRESGARRLVDEDILAAIESGVLQISDFDVSRVVATGYNFKITLAEHEEKRAEITQNGAFKLQAKQTASFRTKEKVTLPDYLDGTIVRPHEMLVEHEVHVLAGDRIHPSWGPGFIDFKIHNASNRSCTLEEYDCLLAARFDYLPVLPKFINHTQTQEVSVTELKSMLAELVDSSNEDGPEEIIKKITALKEKYENKL